MDCWGGMVTKMVPPQATAPLSFDVPLPHQPLGLIKLAISLFITKTTLSCFF
jgi:hypothetical protein